MDYHSSSSSTSPSSSSSSSGSSFSTLRTSTGPHRSPAALPTMNRDRPSSSPAFSSANLSSINSSYPKDTVIVSQVHPRIQGIVVGHMMSSGGAPHLLVYQAGFQRAGSDTWAPPGLVTKLTNKPPQQDPPAIVPFPDLALVKKHLGPLLELDSEITDEHVKPLANLLYPTTPDFNPLRLPRPSILSDEKYEPLSASSTRGPPASSSTPAPFLSSSSSRSPASVKSARPHTPPTVTPAEFAQLTQQLAELAKELRDRRQSPKHFPAATSPLLLPHLYTSYPSAYLAAHHILSLSRSFSHQITWEKASLTHWAKLLNSLT